MIFFMGCAFGKLTRGVCLSLLVTTGVIHFPGQIRADDINWWNADLDVAYGYAETKKRIMDMVINKNVKDGRVYKHSEPYRTTSFGIHIFEGKWAGGSKGMISFWNFPLKRSEAPSLYVKSFDYSPGWKLNAFIKSRTNVSADGYLDRRDDGWVKQKRGLVSYIPILIILPEEARERLSLKGYRLLFDEDDCAIYRKETGFEIDIGVSFMGTGNRLNEKKCISFSILSAYGFSDIKAYQKYDALDYHGELPLGYVRYLYPQVDKAGYHIDAGLNAEELNTALPPAE